MIVWIIVGVLVSTSISVAISIYFFRNYSKLLGQTLKVKFDEVNAELERVKPIIAKAYGILGSMGTTPRQVKAAERMISQDIVGQYPEIKALLGAISPRTEAYLTENPDILMEIIARWGPKAQAILGEKGIKGLLPGRTSSRSREWAWKE